MLCCPCSPHPMTRRAGLEQEPQVLRISAAVETASPPANKRKRAPLYGTRKCAPPAPLDPESERSRGPLGEPPVVRPSSRASWTVLHAIDTEDAFLELPTLLTARLRSLPELGDVFADAIQQHVDGHVVQLGGGGATSTGGGGGAITSVAALSAATSAPRSPRVRGALQRSCTRDRFCPEPRTCRARRSEIRYRDRRRNR